MRKCNHLILATAALLLPWADADGSPGGRMPPAPGLRARLVEARDLAYDANYRNDQAGMRNAIAALQPLTTAREEGAYAHYYLSWTYWLLAASLEEGKNRAGALESAKMAVQHARSGLAARDRDPEFHTALGNALIVVAVLNRDNPLEFKNVATELAGVRRRALELGRDNPRTILMDSGLIFWAPRERGGSQEGGMARWQQARRLFEVEADAKTADVIAPRWGQALSYGWAANLYLRMTPPQKENARRAAETALRMRPDFWYVRERVLPQLRE